MEDQNVEVGPVYEEQDSFNEDTIEDMLEDCEIENVEEVDSDGNEN